jgi:hypothetical protein
LSKGIGRGRCACRGVTFRLRPKAGNATKQNINNKFGGMDIHKLNVDTAIDWSYTIMVNIHKHNVDVDVICSSGRETCIDP